MEIYRRPAAGNEQEIILKIRGILKITVNSSCMINVR